ncbi:hypothetical protein M1M34_gp031 [Haloarcula tailed virus 2]|uniref:Uncharacterized protein n=1 Tax=Haloarcula tailed virus 2 TaxID=2877989 RepID=A0AAE8XZU5_9CAUD|nr:hypothetical protein M1M34_gp031 [Haloarcula tailed virus 2]UBF23182.1 hypothetical protein HATV-2_gp31 [Haloarcula tailed virus 2]
MVEITVELDKPREVMYKEMADLVGEDELNDLIDGKVHELVSYLYDTKEQ